MTANPSLTPRERLDAMVRYESKRWIYPDLPDLNDVLKTVALSLLEKCDALEARIADAGKPCEWEWECGDHSSGCGMGITGWKWKQIPKFCPGCGHPVQVKQPQDAAEEE